MVVVWVGIGSVVVVGTFWACGRVVVVVPNVEDDLVVLYVEGGPLEGVGEECPKYIQAAAITPPRTTREMTATTTSMTVPPASNAATLVLNPISPTSRYSF